MMAASEGVIEILGMKPPELGAVGLLGLAVVMILTGRLVPLTFYKAILAERDAWKAQAQDQKKLIADLTDIARENVEPSKVVAKFITAIQDKIGVKVDDEDAA